MPSFRTIGGKLLAAFAIIFGIAMLPLTAAQISVGRLAASIDAIVGDDIPVLQAAGDIDALMQPLAYLGAAPALVRRALAPKTP